MAGKIPQEFILDLLQRVDIVDLIDARVPLKKTGSNFIARCPFHSEKSPSFSVNREKQFYHCFGCGAHGNAISFLMEYERLSFPESVESLARDAGLTIPRDIATDAGTEASADLSRLYDVQAQIAHFYAKQFKQHRDGSRAIQYLKARGVSGQIARQYMLGFAPPDWRNIPDCYALEELEACGLMVRKDRAYYDRFRDRIIFPIRDRRGRVVGFGGRVLGDGSPKYLNSPETPVFKKHKEVYGLYELQSQVRNPERILIVEGYMDVIALAQHGIPYAVATLGTATSEDHISLLFRCTKELVFCFDGDEAGRSAAWKALSVVLPALKDGRQAKFLMLPEQQDPDSLVRAEGSSRFVERIVHGVPCSEFFFERLVDGGNLESMEERAALANAAKPLLELIPQGVFRTMMMRRLNQLIGLNLSPAGNSTRITGPDRRMETRQKGRPSALVALMTLLTHHPELAKSVDRGTRECLIRHKRFGPILEYLFSIVDRFPDITPGGILEGSRGTPFESAIRSIASKAEAVLVSDAAAEFQGALERIKNGIKSSRIDVLLALAKAGRISHDERKELALLLQQQK